MTNLGKIKAEINNLDEVLMVAAIYGINGPFVTRTYADIKTIIDARKQELYKRLDREINHD